MAIAPFITTGSTYLYKPTVIDCARTSHIVYHNQANLNDVLAKHELSAYEVVSDITFEKSGMRVCAFRLKGTNNIIISYRGTKLTSKANLLIDLGIAATFIEENNSAFVYEHAQIWLERYCNGLLKTMHNNKGFVRYLPTQTALALLGRWGYDLETGKKYKLLGIKHAFQAFARIKKEHPGCNYYITGHSLGGFYAQLVAYHCGHTAYTFNAPGAYQTYRQLHPRWNRALWWIRSKKLITNYVREHDLVGTFGTHLGQTKIIPNVDNTAENTPDEPGYTDSFWLMYDIPSYVRKNHGILHVVEDFVAGRAAH